MAQQQTCTAYSWKARQSGHSPRLLRLLLLRQRLQDLRSTRLEAFADVRAITVDPDLTLLGRLATSQQPAVPAAAGPRIPCRYPPTLSSQNSSIRAKQRVFTRSLHLPGSVSLCGFKRSGLIRWKQWWQDGQQPVIHGFRCRGAVGLVPWPRPLHSAQPSSSSPGMDTVLFRNLSNAVEELDLEWSPPEKPSRSRLDEWFLPECCQAPHQRDSPFFPDVHDEITKSWRAPYSSSPTCLFFLRPHFGRWRGRKIIWQTASPWWVSGRASLPAHGHLAGRQKLPTHPNHVGRLQLSLAEPIHRLDKRHRRFTPWWSCKCYRQNSSAPWMSLIWTPQLSMSCAVQPTWPCASPRWQLRRSADPWPV